MSARRNAEKGPLHEMERLGTQVPAAVKKVHALRHNRSEGREPIPPNISIQQENATMADAAENIQTQQPQSVAAAPAPAPAAATPAPAVVVEVDPQGTTARDLNLNATIKKEESPELSNWEKTKDAGKKGLVIAVAVAAGMALYKGGEALASLAFGGTDTPPPAV